MFVKKLFIYLCFKPKQWKKKREKKQLKASSSRFISFHLYSLVYAVADAFSFEMRTFTTT